MENEKRNLVCVGLWLAPEELEFVHEKTAVRANATAVRAFIRQAMKQEGGKA